MDDDCIQEKLLFFYIIYVYPENVYTSCILYSYFTANLFLILTFLIKELSNLKKQINGINIIAKTILPGGIGG